MVRILSLISVSLFLAACGGDSPEPATMTGGDETSTADAGETADAGPGWTIEEIATIEGFQAPESCAIDPETGLFYLADVGQDLWEAVNIIKKEATHVGLSSMKLWSKGATTPFCNVFDPFLFDRERGELHFHFMNPG